MKNYTDCNVNISVTPARTNNPQNTLWSKKISYNLTAFMQQHKAFHKKLSKKNYFQNVYIHSSDSMCRTN